MIRLGLCCLFAAEPIHFRQTTAAYLQGLSRYEQIEHISALCLHNVLQVEQALIWLQNHSLSSYRLPSSIFPRATHPDVGYEIESLPHWHEIDEACSRIRGFREKHGLRLSLHPDQFNVLSSPRREVVENTIRELNHQSYMADLFGVEIINLHAGGVYGDKKAALKRLEKVFCSLSHSLKNRITLENDDRSYTPHDLLPVCENLHVPFVYDVHHHRCLPDGLSVEEVTEKTVRLWDEIGGEPYFHISSPRNGWESDTPRPHADCIDPEDFPSCWQYITATVDVEAKLKELAILQLRAHLQKIGTNVFLEKGGIHDTKGHGEG